MHADDAAINQFVQMVIACSSVFYRFQSLCNDTATISQCYIVHIGLFQDGRYYPRASDTSLPMDKSIYTREYAALLRLLRKAREDAGMTQVALAEALAEALGTSQSFVNKVEQGDRRLDVIQLRTIITVFGLILPDFSRRLERAITSEGVGRR